MKVFVSLRLLVIFILVALLLSTKTAQAADYTVPCRVNDLIAAINQANASPQDDVINLQAGCTYILTTANNTQNGANGLPVIASESAAGKLTINGNGAVLVRGYHIFLPLLMRGSASGPVKSDRVVMVQANSAADIPDFRIILVASGGHLTLNTVILKNGHMGDQAGGAIFNAGTLVINNSTIADSSAVEGGAIFNVGNLTIYNNVISDNTASGPGGGISSSGVLHVTATLFTGNTAIVGDGIFVSSGESYVIQVDFSGDSAYTCPASPRTIPAGDTPGLIDAIYCANSRPGDDVINLTTGTYTITAANNDGYGQGSSGLPIILNQATAGALTINGNGATIARSGASGTPDFRIFFVESGARLALNGLMLQNAHLAGVDGGTILNQGSLTIQNSTFSNNATTNVGAVIYSTGPSLIVTGSLFSGNTAGLGAGIAVAGGTATITDSTFSSNTTLSMAGGGGVWVYSATVDISGCTFSGNGGPRAGAGGGIFNANGSVTVTNSTFAGNTTYNGAAIYNGGKLTVQHSTISGNAARGNGGGIYQANDTAVTSVGDTILAQNTASSAGPDVSGAIHSLGYNIIGSTSGVTVTGVTTGNLVGSAASPLELGPLQNNGGSTQTMSIGNSSVAINAGNPAFAAPPEYDQRGPGHPRVKNGRIDIGAYESATATNCPLVNEVTIPASDVNALMDAIDCANASPADNIINLTNSIYTLTLVENDGYGQGSTGLPVINSAIAAGKLTINGNNATVQRSSASGTPEFRLLMLLSGSNVTINNLWMQNGRLSNLNGGGIYNNGGTLALVFTNVVGNYAAFGGGLAFENAVVTIRGGMFNTNTSLRDGAAMNGSGSLSVIDGNISWNYAYGLCGGILIGPGTATISQSTIMHNTANEKAGGGGLLVIGANVSVSDSTFWDNGGPNAGSGGALFNGGGTVSVVNSTFTGNQAYDGGAIWNNGMLTLTHSTLSGNSARHNGGGIFQASDTAVLHMGHTIVAGNTAVTSGPDIYGTMSSLGYNVIGNTGGATIQGSLTGNLTDAAAAPLNLGPLQNNGGSTDTMALQAGSVAINAGDPSFAAPPSYDQRGSGYPRVQGGRIDIGAFESTP